MGGVLINGCGAVDTFKKLMLLKTEMCPNCRKVREFYLVRVTMKIHVLFIPTIPLNTKYGIVCSKCKTGRYISEAQMRQFMSADDATRALLYDAVMHPGEEAHPGHAAKLEQDVPVHDAGVPAEVPMAKLPEAAPNAGAPSTCPNCGNALSSTAAFCGICGHAVATVPDSVDHIEAKQTVLPQNECEPASSFPKCGKPIQNTAAFCGNGGAGLRDSAAEAINTAVVPDGPDDAAGAMTADPHSGAETWTCPLCDTPNPADTDRCRLCGQARL